MPERRIRLFTDEMVNPRLAWTLARRGYDVVSCQWVGRANQGISDDDQVTFATQEGRAILTFNARDFDRIHRRWKALGRRLAGIIIATRIVLLEELITMVQRHLDSVTPDEQDNVLAKLPV